MATWETGGTFVNIMPEHIVKLSDGAVRRRRAWRGFCGAMAMLWLGCSDPSATHVPQVGRYAFTTSWHVPGFPDAATAEGELVVLANPPVSEAHMSYTLTLNEPGGPKTFTDQVTWDEVNDWVLMIPGIGRAGVWMLLPHLKRVEDSYECYGNAFSVSYGGAEMTCAFTYLGP